ncbi:tetratricopeptide repeat protein [Methylocella sp.]|jgi:tetratricopeptide (TPR) repeat protein|uniref:tetratricopeptide repeat protein n=1 Tax=Methylocella sp. TaxID=1978226 RepID=UPI003C17CECC
MRRWLFISARLAQLAVAGLIAPAMAGADKQQWPGGLPNDWRVLGDDAGPSPGDQTPGQFDFRRDERGQPFGQAPNLTQRPAPGGPAKSTDPVKDAAAAKAARDSARAEELKKALAPRPEPAALRQRALDELFKHLGAAADPEEAKGFADAIQHIWLQSQSDTANLIMQRAMLASRMRNYPLALTLLDRLVALEPNWAEAWNQRATVRFLAEDFDGSMADIDKVLKLEPRHFGALTGMGVILQREGLDKRALEVFNKALEIYPAQPDLKDSVDKLTLDVNGRDI